jgi:hypothetical protein
VPVERAAVAILLGAVPTLLVPRTDRPRVVHTRDGVGPSRPAQPTRVGVSAHPTGSLTPKFPLRINGHSIEVVHYAIRSGFAYIGLDMADQAPGGFAEGEIGT